MKIKEIVFIHTVKENKPVSIDAKFEYEGWRGNINLHYDNISKLSLEELIELIHERAIRMTQAEMRHRRQRMLEDYR